MKADAPEEIVQFDMGRLELAQNPAAVLYRTAPEKGVDDFIIVPVESLEQIVQKSLYPKAEVCIVIIAHNFLPFCIFNITKITFAPRPKCLFI